MRLRILAAAALLAAAPACRDAAAPAPGTPADLALLVPAAAPYISGTIVARGSRLGADPSVLVATDPGDPGADPADRDGNRSAHVVLAAGVAVVHRDGRPATRDDLQPGRAVTAWVGPTELRSLPPVVFGRVLIVER